MYRSTVHLVLLLIATSSYFLVSTHANKQPQLAGNGRATSCLPRERDALLAFKQGITNDTINLLASWRRGQDCCQWTGVTCSSKNGHVIKLDLNRTYHDPALVGQISPSLLSLEYLEYLDLSTNLLEGPNGTVPEFLGSMKNLRYLDLSYIPFSGRVPPQLGKLSNLRYLDISWMQNTYSTDISWLSRLHFLEYIDMSNTNLSTIVDFPLVANMCPTLQQIALINCSLPSADQSLTRINLTKLVDLDLSRNYFGHSIASSWFWNVTSIKSLDLVSTYLHGPFPDALGRMVSLQRLSFNNNGNGATMTVDLKDLCELEVLWLDGSLSSGNITELVEKLPQCSSKFFFLGSSGNNMTGVLPNMMQHFTGLKFLYLFNNSISGAIPPMLWNFTSLDSLYLGQNKLSGRVPLLPKRLNILDVSMNFLSGQLPLGFRAPNLEILIMSSNYIMGQVPASICESEKMYFMDLSNNFFEGELPHCSRMSNLYSLLLSNNSFSGEFPSWLQSFKSMTFLDLSWNKFCGVLPSWIGELVNLLFLQLSYNNFYGDIPVNITNLRQLQYLNLAANNISGLVPLLLPKLTGMTHKHPVDSIEDIYNVFGSDDEQLFLSIVMKHEELKYGVKGIVDMVGIDLSLNHLTGEIPDEITSFDRVSNLNLSWNHFVGKIPEKIGSMKSMESIDLSRNNLSGEIPQSLSDLTYLSYLDLSYNNLSGTIPSGRQLDTLYTENPSIYDGNKGLCGPPLQRNCLGDNALKHDGQHESEKDSNSLFFYFGLCSGFAVGLWVVLCVLLSF
ncbi:unnamed protein product [Urochloa decumbens]|uniref:Leucine-rich repeat-containing N-terminal plant-type domain-containing protein n=1 Tax=Urochloa decumbens TaxID=240449 RepID=A0ABC9B1V3_9POAL